MKIIIPVFILVVVGVLGLAVTRALHQSERYAKESSQRALVVEAIDLLEKYRNKTGTYPKHLTSLSFTYPDGGGPDLLKDIVYKTSNDTYSLKIISYASGEVIEYVGKAEPTAMPAEFAQPAMTSAH
jgi:Tfp pilus assembly protein PilE